MGRLSAYLFGPLSGFGGLVAAAVAAADQALKLWLLFVYDLGARGMVPLAPFVDLVLTWNTGISYGLFQQDSALGRSLLLGVKLVAVVLLWLWLARTPSRRLAAALGLIIGGAIGNAVDRLIHGAVADFVLLHLTSGQWRFNWYVFNLADAAIVVGVALVLYDSIVHGRAAKAP